MTNDVGTAMQDAIADLFDRFTPDQEHTATFVNPETGRESWKRQSRFGSWIVVRDYNDDTGTYTLVNGDLGTPERASECMAEVMSDLENSVQLGVLVGAIPAGSVVFNREGTDASLITI